MIMRIHGWSMRTITGRPIPCESYYFRVETIVRSREGAVYFEAGGPRPFSVTDFQMKTNVRFVNEREAVAYLDSLGVS